MRSKWFAYCSIDSHHSIQERSRVVDHSIVGPSGIQTLMTNWPFLRMPLGISYPPSALLRISPRVESGIALRAERGAFHASIQAVPEWPTCAPFACRTLGVDRGHWPSCEGTETGCKRLDLGRVGAPRHSPSLYSCVDTRARKRRDLYSPLGSSFVERCVASRNASRFVREA